MFGQVMVQVPKDFQDFDDDDDRINKRLSRWDYWKNLRLLRGEFAQENNSNDHFVFHQWLQDNHGFRPILTIDNQYTDEFEVTDEKKFMVYILKYG